MDTLSDFIANSKAERVGNGWTVYADGENMLGRITDCSGSNEYEAKEDAYLFLKELEAKIKG